MKTSPDARVALFYVTVFFDQIYDANRSTREVMRQFSVIAENAYDAIARTPHAVDATGLRIDSKGIFTDVKFVAWADNSAEVDLK